MNNINSTTMPIPILCYYCCKGGVLKTTSSVLTAWLLSSFYNKNVLYIEADPDNQTGSDWMINVAVDAPFGFINTKDPAAQNELREGIFRQYINKCVASYVEKHGHAPDIIIADVGADKYRYKGMAKNSYTVIPTAPMQGDMNGAVEAANIARQYTNRVVNVLTRTPRGTVLRDKRHDLCRRTRFPVIGEHVEARSMTRADIHGQVPTKDDLLWWDLRFRNIAISLGLAHELNLPFGKDKFIDTVWDETTNNSYDVETTMRIMEGANA